MLAHGADSCRVDAVDNIPGQRGIVLPKALDVHQGLVEEPNASGQKIETRSGKH
jgi:hypothetical protein